jgi:hypothetical protein
MLAASGDVAFLEKQDPADPAISFAMGVSKDKRFIPALAKIARLTGVAQADALMAMGKLKAADELLSLKDSWKSFDDKARESYAHALGMQASEAAIPILGELTTDANWRVRFRAAVGLGATRSAKAGSYILNLLDDKNPSVFKMGLYWCTDTLILKPEQYFPKIIARLRPDEDDQIVKPILHSLLLMWYPDTGQWLSKNQDPSRRVDYPKLSVWKDKSLIEALNGVFTYKDSRLAMDAIDVVIKMGVPLKPDNILRGVDTFNIEDKRFFCERMRSERVPGLEPVFKKMWETNDRMVHVFILQYCALVPTPETFEMAFKAFPEIPKEDEILRMIGVSALAAHVKKLDERAKRAIPIILDMYNKVGWEAQVGLDAALCRAAGRTPLESLDRDPAAVSKRLADWKEWWAKQAR